MVEAWSAGALTPTRQGTRSASPSRCATTMTLTRSALARRSSRRIGPRLALSRERL
jgi:hypothetical protein